ncbi:uncharacterized protein LOC126751159 [Bactrocera neohumeralis]|uniref:uncharacterized protein LOC126751159 n=1 Tax=Bactrocera neohumeralis TaxID=98809 RepID=UPI002165FD1C|nr:uncharacterized protein LOC126751159 [Bactrocera neohumeralis]
MVFGGNRSKFNCRFSCYDNEKMRIVTNYFAAHLPVGHFSVNPSFCVSLADTRRSFLYTCPSSPKNRRVTSRAVAIKQNTDKALSFEILVIPKQSKSVPCGVSLLLMHVTIGFITPTRNKYE